MRIPTVTVNRNGSPVLINRHDFREGIDVLWQADPAPQPDPEPDADESDERAALFARLAELGVKAGGRTGTDKLRAMVAEAEAADADSGG